LHRRHGSREVTDTFIHVSSLLLLASMVPLAAGLALDFHLIAKLILEDERIAMICGMTLFTLLVAFWLGRRHELYAIRHAIEEGREQS